MDICIYIPEEYLIPLCWAGGILLYLLLGAIAYRFTRWMRPNDKEFNCPVFAVICAMVAPIIFIVWLAYLWWKIVNIGIKD